MFLSMNWISDFVDFTGLDKVELIHRFSLSTAEVENEIFYKGADLSGIVVAEIKSVENHPDSKKLHLLKVDIGEPELTDVVCGAPNVRVGMKTAFAKVGAKIGEIEIAPRPLAGVMSYGMCCSEAEIGISDDNSGIMDITDDAANGTDLKDVNIADPATWEKSEAYAQKLCELRQKKGMTIEQARDLVTTASRASSRLSRAES